MNRGAALRFVVTAGLLSVALFGILRLPWVEQNLLVPFTGAQWSLACRLGANPAAPVTVGLSCSAADVIALCLGFILAFPVAWRRRLTGAMLGLLFIAAVNTLRIATLSRVVTDRSLFNLLHIYLWPAVLLVVVSIFVFAWMNRSLRAENGSESPSNGDSSSKRLLSHEGKRFVVLTLLFVALFVGSSSWWMKSSAVLSVASWVAALGAAIIRTFGGEATLIDNYLKTSNGGFMVTQECIMTPLIPVYLATVFAMIQGSKKRLVAVLLAFPIFFLLGSARLLVLAFPPDLIGSPLTAIHGFYQLVVACLLIGFAAYRANDRRTPWGQWIKRGSIAILVGGAVALLIGVTWNRLIFFSLERLQVLFAHAGHDFSDPQRAIHWLAPYQMGLLTGLWLAWKKPFAWRLWLTGAGILAALQPLAIALAGEWSVHLAWEPHVALIRAWAVTLPTLLFLLMLYRSAAVPTTRMIPQPEPGSG